MPVLICPECGAENLPDAEKCWICTASLEGITPPEAKPEHLPSLPQAEDNLTDLLHALKQDDDLGQISAENDDDSPSLLEADAEMESAEGDDDEPEVPEWLNRIRHRAQTEPDSVGEITQKISAAQASLDAEKNEDQKHQFEDMLHKIHGEEDQPAADNVDDGEVEPPGDTSESGTVRSDWLKRIRKKHHPAVAERPEEILSEREGDSLLQWLVALEDGEEAEEADPIEESASGAEATKELTLTTVTDDTREIPLEDVRSLQGKQVELAISREDQERAEHLSKLILEENTPRPDRIPTKSFLPRGMRLAIGFVLITIMSLALFLGTPGEMPPALPSPQSLGVTEWIQDLPAGSSLLIVLDYPAAYAAEMAIIAPPILREIHSSGAEVSILSSAPAGSLLFEQLLPVAGLDAQWVVQDLGYYPVGSFGAYGLAHQVSSTQSQPEFSISFPSGTFEGVLILGDDYEGTMAWIEQFSSLAPDTPILLLVSAQAGPLLQPYWESGQVTGIISGFSDAVDLEEQPPGLANRWRAYQVGTVLMILMLLIGMSLPASQVGYLEGQDGR